MRTANARRAMEFLDDTTRCGDGYTTESISYTRNRVGVTEVVNGAVDESSLR